LKYRVFFILALAILLVSIAPISAQDETTCEDGFRLFDHELLVNEATCIPENPQRVASFDMAGTEFLLYTDGPIVGTFAYVASEINVFTPGLGDELEDVEQFSWPPNLELLTELQPDLIIAFYDAALDLSGVEEIAPLLIYDPTLNKGEWIASTQFYADVFNQQETFDEMLDTYNARVEELQLALGDDRGEIEVSLMLPTTETPLIWLEDSAPGRVLEDVGLGRPEFQINPGTTLSESGANWGYVNISMERLDLADGDEIFIFTWSSSDPDVVAERQLAMEEFQSNALWQSLEGVQAGNVHVVGGHWVRAQTYLTVNLILDDLFANLTDIEPTVASPSQALQQAEATEEPSSD